MLADVALVIAAIVKVVAPSIAKVIEQRLGKNQIEDGARGHNGRDHKGKEKGKEGKNKIKDGAHHKIVIKERRKER